MVRRFEMPKQIMNEIKKMDIPDQLRELDKYFNKIGMTQKLIDEMGGTTLGIWSQIKEQTAVIMREMGKPGLQTVKSFLDQIQSGLENGNADRWANIGARWINATLTGLTNGATSLYNWFDSLTKSDEWKTKTTMFSKIDFFVGDVYERFLSWLTSENGRQKIERTTSDLIQIVGGALNASSEALKPIGEQLGSAIGKGVLSGIKTSLSEWTANLPSVGEVLYGAGQGIWNAVVPDEWESHAKAPSWLRNQATELKVRKSFQKTKAEQLRGDVGRYKTGLDYVPHDWFPAYLDKGEKVLTAREADDYRKGKSGGGNGFTIVMNGTVIREEADINKLGAAIVREFRRAGGDGA
ncbi:hypothetical protein [Peribacillus saganii]|nr:hypothetical protein [Peribacillus saganii]